MITENDFWAAWQDCLRHKRKTSGAIEFELNLFENIYKLTESSNNKTYLPGISNCFVVTRPRLREVFAAGFYDRVVHTWVFQKLNPYMEKIFNDRTFNCREGKGQLKCVKTLAEDIRVVSNNYTKDCYVCKVDISGFFMSINRKLMAKIVDDFILSHYTEDDREILRYICRELVETDPSIDCHKLSNPKLFDLVPTHKSLLKRKDGCGLGIGNLDDMYMVSDNKKEILSTIPIIRKELAKIGLKLNEKKFYLQHYSKGIEFTGAVIKPGRVYICNRTKNSFLRSVNRLNKCTTLYAIKQVLPSINSYLGLVRQYDSYHIRRSALTKLDSRLFKFIYIGKYYASIHLKKKYRFEKCA
jgi:hypothetical protein